MLGAYVALEALLGIATVTLPYPLSTVAQAVGYILMAPTVILALPLTNAVESRLYVAVGYSTTTQAVTLAVLFGLGALGNGLLFSYLRSADGRY